MAQETITLKGAEYILRILELCDVETVFGYPGGAILPIYDALPRSKINHVLVRHEQGAAFAASGFGRVADKVGVCFATSGPGATNLLTGIADAYCDSVPVIAVTGQVGYPLIGTDAFQETDITGVFLPITKKTYLLKDITKAEEIFKEAFEIAKNGRPGPVLIDIPKDVQSNPVELPSNWEENFKRPHYYRVNKAQASQFEAASELLKTAKKPLILAGHGVLISKATKALVSWAEQENLPIVTTILGKDILPPTHPLYFSWLGMHGMKYANLAIQECDLIIAAGVRFDDRITGKLDTFAPNAKLLHIDIDDSENSKIRKADVFLHSDLLEAIKNMPQSNTEEAQRHRSEWLQHLTALREQYPLLQPDYSIFDQVAGLKILNEYIAKDAYVVTDVGQHQMWSAQYLFMLPNHFVTSGGLGAMGFGLPAAMGVQAAHPDKEVWCIAGDGSFMMNIQELITCLQENYPIKILVMDNSYLGMVRQWQEQFYANNLSGVVLNNPDFAMVARALGMKTATAEDTEELALAIEQAQGTKGPFLIHAKVVREDKVLPMVPPGKSLSDTLYYTDVENKKYPRVPVYVR